MTPDPTDPVGALVALVESIDYCRRTRHLRHPADCYCSINAALEDARAALLARPSPEAAVCTCYPVTGDHDYSCPTAWAARNARPSPEAGSQMMEHHEAYCGCRGAAERRARIRAAVPPEAEPVCGECGADMEHPAHGGYAYWTGPIHPFTPAHTPPTTEPVCPFPGCRTTFPKADPGYRDSWSVHRCPDPAMHAESGDTDRCHPGYLYPPTTEPDERWGPGTSDYDRGYEDGLDARQRAIAQDIATPAPPPTTEPVCGFVYPLDGQTCGLPWRNPWHAESALESSKDGRMFAHRFTPPTGADRAGGRRNRDRGSPHTPLQAGAGTGFT